VATVSGGTSTADRVRDLSKIQEERKQWGPPPPGAPGGPGGRHGKGPGGGAPGMTPASPSSYDEDGDAIGA
jgi:hypothetical protein